MPNLRLGRSLALICGGLLAVAVFGHLLQTGFQPQPQRLAPDFSRLDPIAIRLADVFGRYGGTTADVAAEARRSGGAAAWAVWDQRDRIMALSNLAPVGVR
jgi:flagellar biosynthesis protein FlhB